jgi:hypothetical protein
VFLEGLQASETVRGEVSPNDKAGAARERTTPASEWRSASVSAAAVPSGDGGAGRVCLTHDEGHFLLVHRSHVATGGFCPSAL